MNESLRGNSIVTCNAVVHGTPILVPKPVYHLLASIQLVRVADGKYELFVQPLAPESCIMEPPVLG